MSTRLKLLGALLLVGMAIQPSVVSAEELNPKKSFVRVLSDHPGAATALTARQKVEIQELLAKASENQNFICTAASLSGQRESMYRVVRLRAQLVCDYAKSINPALKITLQEKTTAARKFNGRVVVVSR